MAMYSDKDLESATIIPMFQDLVDYEIDPALLNRLYSDKFANCPPVLPLAKFNKKNRLHVKG